MDAQQQCLSWRLMMLVNLKAAFRYGMIVKLDLYKKIVVLLIVLCSIINYPMLWLYANWSSLENISRNEKHYPWKFGLNPSSRFWTISRIVYWKVTLLILSELRYRFCFCFKTFYGIREYIAENGMLICWAVYLGGVSRQKCKNPNVTCFKRGCVNTQSRGGMQPWFFPKIAYGYKTGYLKFWV